VGGARPPDVKVVGEEAALTDGEERCPRTRLSRASYGGGDGGAKGGDEGDVRRPPQLPQRARGGGGARRCGGQW
jgi:hypothetical protein